jgi:hypothetical protein
MRVLLVALSLGLSATSHSQDLNTVTFHVDDTDKEIKLPNDACAHYLDDPSNFKIQKTSPTLIQVIALGRSERSATLLIDCPEQSLVYSLVFYARSINSKNDSLSQIVRPQSSLGLEIRASDQGPGAVEFDFTDRSLDPLQIVLRRVEAFNTKPDNSTRSLDVEHRFGLSSIGYGYQITDQPNNKQAVLRTNLQIAGITSSHTKTLKYQQNFIADSYWLRLPAPLGVGLGVERNSKGRQAKVIDRFFNTRMGDFSTTTGTRYQQTLHEDGTTTKSIKFTTDQSSRLNQNFRLTNKNHLTCGRLNACTISEWAIKSKINYRQHDLSLDYGIWPHLLGTGLSTKFFGNQRFNMSINRKLRPIETLKRWPHFAVDEDVDSTSEISGVHLELKNSKWTYYADQSASLISGKIWSNTIGARYEGDEITAGIAGSIEGSNYRLPTFNASLRYFLSENLRSLSLRTSKNRLLVKVRSNAPGVFINGAVVELRKSGQLIATRVSSANGMVEFSEARCCETYNLSVELHGHKAESIVHVTPLSLNPSDLLIIEDHNKLHLDFLLVKPENRFEKANISNVFEEIGESIVSCPGCIQVNNDIYAPKDKRVSFEFNSSLLPFGLELDRIEPDFIDSSDTKTSQIRVLLKARGSN